jgi:hypothetical protein
MKIILLATSLFTGLLLNAQIKKGALFIGGDIQVYGNKYKSTDSSQYTRHTNNYNFSPSVGWVVKDNMIVGGKLFASFFKDKEEHPNDYESKSNRIGAGIWIRKYLSLGKSFYLFGDASLNGQSIYMKQETSIVPSYYKEKGFAINAAVFPGISYQIKNSLFIEAALNNLISFGYERKNTERGNQAAPFSKGLVNYYNLSSSLGNGAPLQIGIRWIIAKK